MPCLQLNTWLSVYLQQASHKCSWGMGHMQSSMACNDLHRLAKIYQEVSKETSKQSSYDISDSLICYLKQLMHYFIYKNECVCPGTFFKWGSYIQLSLKPMVYSYCYSYYHYYYQSIISILMSWLTSCCCQNYNYYHTYYHMPPYQAVLTWKCRRASFWAPSATSSTKPALGRYRLRSAITNPTRKSKLLAGRNGTAIKTSDISNLLQTSSQ